MRLWLSLCLMLLLCGCGKASNVEETVLTKAFASYVTGMVYDEVCNHTAPQSRLDFSKPENSNLAGNQMLLVTRIGGLWHARHPEQSANESVKNLLKARQNIEDKSRAMFKKEGCDSKDAQAAAKALALATKMPPWTLNDLLDREIKKRGGTITAYDKPAPKKEQP